VNAALDIRALTGSTPVAANDHLPTVVVGGQKTVRLSLDQLADQMVRDCLTHKRSGAIAKTVFAANGHAIAFAALDHNFREMFEDADIVHADGQAAVFASKLLTKTPIAERSATTDFIHTAAAAGARHGLRFFLFGATEEINRRTAAMLAAQYPGLQVVGHRHGYFSADEEEEICDEVNASGADVLWTGLSVPLEYEFATRNKHRLNVGWIVTCGGCFNYITGDYARAPAFMQKYGLEWLFRLAKEPRRLFWRYAVTNPVALVMLLLRTAETAVLPAGFAEPAHAPETSLGELRRA
jgi:N-acetylglucosaminyldiphosphoundecaprenol N-acetyl-beta-D-mannosaminyltransferase